MSEAKIKLESAMKHAMGIRPKAGGFPVLAEVLRAAGVKRNIWSLPSCQSLYIMNIGNVVSQGTPLVSGLVDVLSFNQDALIKALRADQNGLSTFPEFLESTWKAGVVGYDVDFDKRVVKYYGANGECYLEEYPAVHL